MEDGGSSASEASTLLETYSWHLKMDKMDGWNTVLVSFWDGLFSGAMLALGRVCRLIFLNRIGLVLVSLIIATNQYIHVLVGKASKFFRSPCILQALLYGFFEMFGPTLRKTEMDGLFKTLAPWAAKVRVTRDEATLERCGCW